MAPSQACHSQQRSFDEAMGLQTGHRVGRAGRVELAGRAGHRRDELLIQPDQADGQCRWKTPDEAHNFHSRRTARSRSWCSCPYAASPGNARTTMEPAGRCSHIAARACLTWRCRRWRCTAPENPLPTTTAARGRSESATKCTTRLPLRTRRPWRIVERTRDRGCRRSSRASTVTP